MNKERNLIFLEQENFENFENEKEVEYNFANKENIYPVFPNKIDISLDEIKNIMNDGPKINLEEKDNCEEELYFTKNSKVELQSTENSTKTSTTLDNKEETFNRIINFKTSLRKKRGRKEKIKNKNNKKCHCSEDFDNIQRKIQVHFISFLIRLSNDALKTIFGQKTKYHFKHVKYELKRIVNHNYIEFLKKCNYSDIMQMKISPKNKRFGEDSNKETFKEVCKHSTFLEKIFEKKIFIYVSKILLLSYK